LHKAQVKGISQLGNITWNIFERVNIQVELGSGQFDWQWKQDQNQFISGKLNGGLIWSGSAKAVFLELKDTSIAADAHVGGWNWMEGPVVAGGTPLEGTARSHMWYWQLAGSITQKIYIFFPYLGIAANQTELKISHLSTGTGWLRSRHQLGAFGGCTLSTGSYFFLNLEWRSGFEQAFSISGQFRF
jgi:hypothetical protein